MKTNKVGKFVIAVKSEIVGGFCEAAHGVFSAISDAVAHGKNVVNHTQWCVAEKREFKNGTELNRCSRVFNERLA